MLKKLEGNTVAISTRKDVFFDKMEAIKLEVYCRLRLINDDFLFLETIVSPKNDF